VVGVKRFLVCLVCLVCSVLLGCGVVDFVGVARGTFVPETEWLVIPGIRAVVPFLVSVVALPLRSNRACLLETTALNTIIHDDGTLSRTVFKLQFWGHFSVRGL